MSDFEVCASPLAKSQGREEEAGKQETPRPGLAPRPSSLPWRSLLSRSAPASSPVSADPPPTEAQNLRPAPTPPCTVWISHKKLNADRTFLPTLRVDKVADSVGFGGSFWQVYVTLQFSVPIPSGQEAVSVLQRSRSLIGTSLAARPGSVARIASKGGKGSAGVCRRSCPPSPAPQQNAAHQSADQRWYPLPRGVAPCDASGALTAGCVPRTT